MLAPFAAFNFEPLTLDMLFPRFCPRSPTPGHCNWRKDSPPRSGLSAKSYRLSPRHSPLFQSHFEPPNFSFEPISPTTPLLSTLPAHSPATPVRTTLTQKQGVHPPLHVSFRNRPRPLDPRTWHRHSCLCCSHCRLHQAHSQEWLCHKTGVDGIRRPPLQRQDGGR